MNFFIYFFLVSVASSEDDFGFGLNSDNTVQIVNSQANSDLAYEKTPDISTLRQGKIINFESFEQDGY